MYEHALGKQERSIDWSLPEEIGFILLRRRDWRRLWLRTTLVKVPVYREPTITVVLSDESYTPAWERETEVSATGYLPSLDAGVATAMRDWQRGNE